MRITSRGIKGSGAGGAVAFFASANRLTSDLANFAYNDTNDVLAANVQGQMDYAGGNLILNGANGALITDASSGGKKWAAFTKGIVLETQDPDAERYIGMGADGLPRVYYQSAARSLVPSGYARWENHVTGTIATNIITTIATIPLDDNSVYLLEYAMTAYITGTPSSRFRKVHITGVDRTGGAITVSAGTDIVAATGTAAALDTDAFAASASGANLLLRYTPESPTGRTYRLLYNLTKV